MSEVGINDNQEDSLIFNEASIDRGMFRSLSLKKYITSIQKNQSTSQDDVFMKPDATKVIGMKENSYDKLNDKGYVPEETIINNGDIILAKVTPIQDVTGSNKQFKDSSEIYKGHASGVIDRVYIGIQNQDGYETRKMLVRSEREPHIGDKYACYTPEHDVLTENGWKSIAEITKDDLVATLVDGKYISYQKPLNTFVYDINEKIYRLRSQQIDLDVTQNHKLYVKRRNHDNYELIEAQDIHQEEVYFKTNNDDVLLRIEGLYDYKGKVYCIEVPSHVLMVRRNGKPVWCGNSRHGLSGRSLCIIKCRLVDT